MSNSPTPLCLQISFQGLRLHAQSDDPTDYRWLSDFFGACFDYQFVPQALSPKESIVRLARDPDAWRTIHAAVPLPTIAPNSALAEDHADSLVAFLQDSQVVRLPIRRLPDGTIIATESQFDVAYAISPSGTVDLYDMQNTTSSPPVSHSTVAADAPRIRRARLAWMRVVREKLMDHVFRLGGEVLHASAIELAGRAYLFAGEKNSGKTTIALALLLGSDRCRYLANDRVATLPTNWGIVCAGIPTIVSIRRGSAQFVPHLAERLAAVERDFLGRSAVPDPEGRWLLGATQITQLLGTRLVPSSPLGGIILPEVDSNVSEYELVRLPLQATDLPLQLGHHAHLRTQLFPAPPNTPPNTLPAWLAPAPVTAPADSYPATASYYEQLRSVPVFRLRLGPQAYAPLSLARMVDELSRMS